MMVYASRFSFWPCPFFVGRKLRCDMRIWVKSQKILCSSWFKPPVRVMRHTIK